MAAGCEPKEGESCKEQSRQRRHVVAHHRNVTGRHAFVCRDVTWWVAYNNHRRAPAGAALIKDKPRIVFDAVLPQKPEIFIFKGHLPVMFFLAVNVLHDTGQIGRAHTERAIPLLPCETATMLVHPF